MDFHKLWLDHRCMCAFFHVPFPHTPTLHAFFLLWDETEMRVPLQSLHFSQSGKELVGEKYLVTDSPEPPKTQPFLFPMCQSGSEYSDVGLYDVDQYLLSLQSH